MDPIPPSHPRLARDRLLGLLLVLAALFAAGFFTLTWRTGDDARYIGLARSLLEGRGYTSAYLPHDPPETITPPAQPVMIAAAMALFGRGVLPGQLFSVAMFILSAIPVYAWARNRLGDRPLAFCVAAMGLFAFPTLTMTSWYMVEVHFIAASFLALALADHRPFPVRPGFVFALGLACGYAYLIRATGLAFAAAGGLYFLARREWRFLFAFAAGFLLLAAPWMVRTYLVTGATEGYLSFQKEMVGARQGYPWARIPGDIANAFPVYFIQALPDALFYRLTGEYGLLRKIGLGAFDPVVRWAILGLVSAGFLRRLRRPGIGELYWVFFWLLITAPPFPPQGHWYVYPLLPMAALYLVESLRLLAGMAARAQARIAAPRWAFGFAALFTAYSLAIAATGAAVHFNKERQRWGLAPWAPERYATYQNEYMEAWGRMVEAGLWIASNLPPDTLVASRQPAHLYLITGREGWRYDLPEVPGASLHERMDLQAGRRPVVLVEDAFIRYAGASFSYGTGHWALRDLFESRPASMELIHECGPPATRVWRFRRDPAEGDHSYE